MRPKSSPPEVILHIPQDQIEVIEVTDQQTPLERDSSFSPRSQSQAKAFSFNLHSHSGPIPLSPLKILFGCAFSLLIFIGLVVAFFIGVLKIIQALWSLIG